MSNLRQYIFIVTLFFVLLTSTVSAAEHAEEFTLNQLMQSLAATGDSKASYSETRSTRLSRRPLESSGELEFIAPNTLIRRIILPRPAVYEVRGDSVMVEQRGKRRNYSLQQLGAMAGFVESLRATLAGDLSALENHYKLSLTGDMHKWELQLVPESSALAKKIKYIEIQGGFSVLLGQMLVVGVTVKENNGSITNTLIVGKN